VLLIRTIVGGAKRPRQRRGSGAANMRGNKPENTPDFLRGSDFQKPTRCLPSLAADCSALHYLTG